MSKRKYFLASLAIASPLVYFGVEWWKVILMVTAATYFLWHMRKIENWRA